MLGSGSGNQTRREGDIARIFRDISGTGDETPKRRRLSDRGLRSWESGPHSAGFARIFLDKKHNTANMLMDDCLRCHGMYYEGGIGDLVQPLSRTGPWRLTQPQLADMPSMPCVTCHQVHRQGDPMHKTGVEGRPAGPAPEVARRPLGLFHRHPQQYVPVAEFRIPAMKEGVRV